MSKLSRRELELRQYWLVMQEGVAQATVSQYRDGLDALAHYSDWPRLKAACSRSAARFERAGYSYRGVLNG